MTVSLHDLRVEMTSSVAVLGDFQCAFVGGTTLECCSVTTAGLPIPRCPADR